MIFPIKTALKASVLHGCCGSLLSFSGHDNFLKNIPSLIFVTYHFTHQILHFINRKMVSYPNSILYLRLTPCRVEYTLFLFLHILNTTKLLDLNHTFVILNNLHSYYFKNIPDFEERNGVDLCLFLNSV